MIFSLFPSRGDTTDNLIRLVEAMHKPMWTEAVKAPHKCPTCNGHGTVMRPPHIPGDQMEWAEAEKTGPYECPACKGQCVLWG